MKKQEIAIPVKVFPLSIKVDPVLWRALMAPKLSPWLVAYVCQKEQAFWESTPHALP